MTQVTRKYYCYDDSDYLVQRTISSGESSEQMNVIYESLSMLFVVILGKWFLYYFVNLEVMKKK